MIDRDRNPVLGYDGFPLIYQVVSVYKNKEKAGIVNPYGEYVGLHSLKNLELVSDIPIFKKSDYKIGTTVIWVDNDDVFEGVISDLHESLASVTDVKKLMPIDYSVRVPYWKIPEGRMSYDELTSSESDSNIGDDPNKRRE